MKTKLFFIFLLLSQISIASEVQPKLIQIFRWSDGKQIKATTAALVNMDEIMDQSGADCQQFIGPITVEGIQFSKSGVTLESFRFTDASGSQWSVPTGIDKLSNAERGSANSFIRVGHRYLAHIQVCGSGGFSSLVSLYDMSIKFKP